MPIKIAEPPLTASQRKERQIVEAAHALFIEHGYGATSMDMIARHANVSKATLYAHAESKDNLFARMVSQTCQKQAEVLTQAAMGGATIGERLSQVGMSFLRFMLRPEILGIYRVVVAETARFPELGQAFYETGPRRMQGHLCSFLMTARDAGELQLDDPLDAARQFIGMVRGDLYFQLLLGLRSGFSEAEIAAVVDSAVRVFLAAYAVQRA